MWEYELGRVRDILYRAAEQEQEIYRTPTRPGGILGFIACMTENEASSQAYREAGERCNELTEEVQQGLSEAGEEIQGVLDWLEERGITRESLYEVLRPLKYPFRYYYLNPSRIDRMVNQIQGLVDLLVEMEGIEETAEQSSSELKAELRSRARARGFNMALGFKWRSPR